MDDNSRLSVVEALVLASPEPLSARKIAEMVEGVTPNSVGRAVAQLNNRYMEAGCSFRVRELAGGYQLYIVPEFAGYVQEMSARRRKMRLTRASLETLAVVAYRQPVTKSEIEHVRGVASDGVLHNLLQKKLITIRGRAKTVGKPLQYGTTDEFLKFFGLASLGDLPKMSEIEELIAAQEPANQTQLELAQYSEDEPVTSKLNVADGTYRPSSDSDDEEETSTVDALEGSNNSEAPESEEDDETDGETVREPEAMDEDEESEDETAAAGDRDMPAGVIVDMDTTG